MLIVISLKKTEKMFFITKWHTSSGKAGIKAGRLVGGASKIG